MPGSATPETACGRRTRAAVVAIVLGAACVSTLALYVGDARASRTPVPITALAARSGEVRLYEAEMGHLGGTAARVVPVRGPESQTEARKISLWNAAADDEVHVRRNGRLSSGVLFPAARRGVDEKTADMGDTMSPKIDSLVAQAGSESGALEKAIEQDERLRKELAAQKRAAAAAVKQNPRSQQLLAAAAGGPAPAFESTMPALKTVGVQEDPQEMADCLQEMKDIGMKEAEAVAKCIKSVQKDDNTITTVDEDAVKPATNGGVSGGRGQEDQAKAAHLGVRRINRKQALLTRSDVPMSQWDNVTEWGPDVQWVDQARAEVQAPPQPDGLGEVPESLQPLVDEVHTLQNEGDTVEISIKDEPPSDVAAWQAFADKVKDGTTTGDAYMAHIKAGGSADDMAAPKAQAQAQVQAQVVAGAATAAPASSPLQDRGEGDLFWDIVKGRVDMTPPPIGELGGKEGQAAAVQPEAAADVAASRDAAVPELLLSPQEMQELQGVQLAAQFPPQCPVQFVGKSQQQCVGSGEDCALCLDGNGFCKPTGSSLGLSRVDGVGGLADYYYLNVLGDVGHPLRVILRATDGYHKSWDQFGQLWTDRIHRPGRQGRAPDAVDHVQVQDLTTGAVAFFQFPCKNATESVPAVGAPAVLQAAGPGAGGEEQPKQVNINIFLGKGADGAPAAAADRADQSAWLSTVTNKEKRAESLPAPTAAVRSKAVAGGPAAVVEAAEKAVSKSVARKIRVERENRALRTTVASLEDRLRAAETKAHQSAGVETGADESTRTARHDATERVLAKAAEAMRGSGEDEEVARLQREGEDLAAQARRELEQTRVTGRHAVELPTKESPKIIARVPEEEKLKRRVQRQEETDVVKEQVRAEVKRQIREEEERRLDRVEGLGKSERSMRREAFSTETGRDAIGGGWEDEGQDEELGDGGGNVGVAEAWERSQLEREVDRRDSIPLQVFVCTSSRGGFSWLVHTHTHYMRSCTVYTTQIHADVAMGRGRMCFRARSGGCGVARSRVLHAATMTCWTTSAASR